MMGNKKSRDAEQVRNELTEVLFFSFYYINYTQLERLLDCFYINLYNDIPLVIWILF